MKKILVTGADGFVGRTMSEHLVASGHTVLRVVRVRGDDGAIAVGDIASYHEWPSLLASVDVVVHLAARAHVLREVGGDSLERFRRVNVAATLQLARAAARAGVRRFIFLSSIGVNGVSTADRAFCEADEPNPSEPYAISKWEAEQGLLAIGERMEITRVRSPLILGAGVKGNLQRLVKLVDSGFPLPLGAIRNRRSFIALDDLCKLLALCVAHERAGGELFLAADAEDLSTPDLLRSIADGLGRPVHLVPVPLPALRLAARAIGKEAELQRMASSLRVRADRVREILCWKSTIGLRSAIKSMTECYLREHGH